jgi:hypothetical protein
LQRAAFEIPHRLACKDILPYIFMLKEDPVNEHVDHHSQGTGDTP